MEKNTSTLNSITQVTFTVDTQAIWRDFRRLQTRWSTDAPRRLWWGHMHRRLQAVTTLIDEWRSRARTSTQQEMLYKCAQTIADMINEIVLKVKYYKRVERNEEEANKAEHIFAVDSDDDDTVSL